MIVHGQSHGGIAHGVGQAMWEECAIDPASGQPLCASFLDYGMPRSDNLPSFAVEIVEVLSPTNPFGIKAGGEGGCTPALAVVVSAILDGLAPLGVRDITMPTTPFKVWQVVGKSPIPLVSAFASTSRCLTECESASRDARQLREKRVFCFAEAWWLWSHSRTP